jgi:hypothetical protein
LSCDIWKSTPVRVVEAFPAAAELLEIF